MTRVLVSGGTGYVGRFIVEDLLANGYKVTVGGRTPPTAGFFSRPVAFVPLALDPDRDQPEIFDNIYYFVHAAFSHVPGKYRDGEGGDPAGFRSANLDGSMRLFESARDAGVRRCIFLSSRAVYGVQQPGQALSEDMHCHPDTLYGQVKLLAERGLTSLCNHGFMTTNLRVTGVYGAAGPGVRHKWASLFEDYLTGRPTAARNGTEVHGSDLAKAVRIILTADAIRINGETFNVSDILVGHHDILSLVQTLTGSKHNIPQVLDASTYNTMDISKLRALGWEPGGPARLKQTIEELLEGQPV